MEQPPLWRGPIGSKHSNCRRSSPHVSIGTRLGMWMHYGKGSDAGFSFPFQVVWAMLILLATSLRNDELSWGPT